jgi:energy-converting hydrogenase Eha subunit A
VKRLRIESKAALGLAGLLSFPLYIAALMASSLALDRPRLVGAKEFPTSSSTEAKIWLAALIAPAIVLAVGALALPFKRVGVYVTALTGIAICLVLPHVSHGWIGRHERRFPFGMDFLRDSNVSNLSSHGEWEKAAQETVASITHWTLGLAVGAIVIALLLEWRRRRGADAMPLYPTPAAITGEPEASPAVLPDHT